jgi:Transport and Golgi organisation 2
MGMCTAVLSIQPGRPVLLAGVRDEFTGRAWVPPGRHWPERPALIGGMDLQAGGTWLAVDPDARRVACVLNGIGQQAPLDSRRSRGELPLAAASGGQLDRSALGSLDPFRLLTAEPGRAIIQSWDGREFTERELPPGLHFVVNSGLASDLANRAAAPVPPPAAPAPPATAPAPPAAAAVPAPASAERVQNGREHELARIDHFVSRFQAALRPEPRPGLSLPQAWGQWLPLVNGDNLGTDDLRALIVRRDLGEGRIWGTTSISLVALATGWVRYDFTGEPGRPSAWQSVL